MARHMVHVNVHLCGNVVNSIRKDHVKWREIKVPALVIFAKDSIKTNEYGLSLNIHGTCQICSETLGYTTTMHISFIENSVIGMLESMWIGHQPNKLQSSHYAIFQNRFLVGILMIIELVVGLGYGRVNNVPSCYSPKAHVLDNSTSIYDVACKKVDLWSNITHKRGCI